MATKTKGYDAEVAELQVLRSVWRRVWSSQMSLSERRNYDSALSDSDAAFAERFPIATAKIAAWEDVNCG